MYVQVGDFGASRGPTTVPPTRISCNTVFSKSQNARKAGPSVFIRDPQPMLFPLTGNLLMQFFAILCVNGGTWASWECLKKLHLQNFCVMLFLPSSKIHVIRGPSVYSLWSTPCLKRILLTVNCKFFCSNLLNLWDFPKFRVLMVKIA